MKNTIRTFIAVPVPKNVKLNLLNVINSTCKKINSPLIKKIKPDNLHLTLQFIGDTLPETIPVIIKLLNEVKISAPLNLTIAKPGYFIKRKEPAVLWLGIDDEFNTLIEVYQNLQIKLKTAKLNIDSKKFKPHLTIAYIKPGFNEENLKSELHELIFADKIQFNAEEINLYKSTLLPAGADHEIIFSRKLK